MKDDTVYLRHILECVRRIEENVAGGCEQFMASHTLQDAVLRNLQTMTEATQRLSDALKAARVHSQTLPLSSSTPSGLPSGLAPPGKHPMALVVPMPV